GLFIQLVDDPRNDCNVPETDLTFGQVIRAQAHGDYLALRKRKRRILRVNLQADAVNGLKQLQKLIF
ncbi:MAG: hypothetical protein V3V48_10240, partial [Candidatus Aminicenantaceae bacterium]